MLIGQPNSSQAAPQVPNSGSESTSSACGSQNDNPVARDDQDSESFSLRRRREREQEQQDGSGGQGPPSGGPLGLRAGRPEKDLGIKSLAAAAEKLVDRLTVGQNRGGLPEVRMDISAGALAGAQVRLAAGRNGIEATIIAPPEAARHVIEAQLSDLAKTLEQKGITLSRCEVLDRNQQQARDQRQNRQQHRSHGYAEDPST